VRVLGTIDSDPRSKKANSMKLIHLLLGIAVPPLGVFLAYGLSTTFVISVLLTILGWIPGSIHGVWAIAKHYENQERAY
jgi:uncharacterized membrane protein YqaE (UPF0057 family)